MYGALHTVLFQFIILIPVIYGVKDSNEYPQLVNKLGIPKDEAEFENFC